MLLPAHSGLTLRELLPEPAKHAHEKLIRLHAQLDTHVRKHAGTCIYNSCTHANLYTSESSKCICACFVCMGKISDASGSLCALSTKRLLQSFFCCKHALVLRVRLGLG